MIGKLPDTRDAITKKFALKFIDENDKKTARELKFYITAGMYADTTLGEIFIKAEERRVDGAHDEQPSVITSFAVGALDTIAMTISVGLQHGAPLATLTEKLRHNRFGPSGFTGDPDFPSCTSVFDLIAQWLQKKFPDGKLAVEKGREAP